MGDDGGQMLLLTSVILLIGFIALSAMVIRVTQLPGETTQESRRPIDLEADAVAEGMHQILKRIHEQTPVTNLTGSDPYRADVEDSLRTLVDVEAGRGFQFEWIDDPVSGDTVTCVDDTPAVDQVTVGVTVVLRDLDTRVQITVTEALGSVTEPASCAPS